MHPAFSVIFLTTLIGAGQGLFLALFVVQALGVVDALPMQDGANFYATGSAVSLLLLVLGLVASFFHLGHPERAWRSAARWRTSWLSREVIALPAVMGAVFLYGVLHYYGVDINIIGASNPQLGALTFWVGLGGFFACIALFVCTGMIYACLKFIEEWHSPLTLINYTLLGCASGFILATALAALTAPDLVNLYGRTALVLTLFAFVFRAASLIRNKRIRHMSNLQTAIGVKHAKIQQKAQGAMGGSFNTREFFHGKTREVVRAVKWSFLILVFPVPLFLVWIGLNQSDTAFFAIAFVVQYLGLLAERWFFFAQARHPQNLYYQAIS
jgi:DMSO reductase anchor subunit